MRESLGSALDRDESATNFMHLPLRPPPSPGNCFPFPCRGEAWWPQRWSGRFGENKNLLSLWGIETTNAVT